MVTTEENAFSSRAVETSIRIGLIALLVVSCFQVVRPFVQTIIWGIILAIAIHPVYVRLARAMGGRERLSAAVLVLVSLLLLIVPLVMITTGLVESATELAGKLHAGEIAVPPAAGCGRGLADLRWETPRSLGHSFAEPRCCAPSGDPSSRGWS